MVWGFIFSYQVYSVYYYTTNRICGQMNKKTGFFAG
jgi:hypothetical protein